MTNRNILNEADHLLVKHGVSELPLTMRKAEIIAQFSGWLLLTYDEGKGIIDACGAEETAERYPAFTLVHNKQNVILYRANLSYEHKLFCILHEFGHIVLKHTAEKNVLGVTPTPEETARLEREADDFAAEMLAPSCVMYSLGIRSAHQLERFGLTAEQALRHCDNLREPEAEIEKALCERLPAVNYRKRTKRVNISRCLRYGVGVCSYRHADDIRLCRKREHKQREQCYERITDGHHRSSRSNYYERCRNINAEQFGGCRDVPPGYNYQQARR